jgi:mannose-6-phosphate isomerase-like protein (cupin superfamily)
VRERLPDRAHLITQGSELMLKTQDFVEPSIGSDVLKAREMAMAENTKPSVFTLRAQLLDQGRTDTVLAAAEDLIIRLKIYASGGENELHTHTGEDHSFIVLQGSARFFGPEGEEIELGAYEGIMLPRGSFYRFYATSKEPLVMIRAGSPSPRKQEPPHRLDIEGNELRGDSQENKSVPVVFRAGAFFGPPAE